MGLSRISSASMMTQGGYNIQTNLSLLNDLENKMSTQKNITKPSDDPVGLTQLLQVQNQANSETQYGKNVDDATSEISETDSALTGIQNVIQTAHTLAVQGANGTNSTAQLKAIATQVNGLINQLVTLGNTTYAGRYVFAGFKTDTPPFAASALSVTYPAAPGASPVTASAVNVSYQGTSLTDAFQRKVQISSSISIPVNLNGDSVLGHVSLDAQGNPTGSGPLYSLTKLASDLQSNNTTAINKDIDAINDDLTTTTVQQATVGSIQNQLTLAKSRITDSSTITSQQISNIQDVDMAQTISDLNFQQNVYEASLQSMSIVMKTSLLNLS